MPVAITTAGGLQLNSQLCELHFDLLVYLLEHAVLVAEDGHHVVLGALAFFDVHGPKVGGQSSLGHHRHQALLHLQPESTDVKYMNDRIVEDFLFLIPSKRKSSELV